MNRRLMGVIGAALLAIVGTFAILGYVRDADDRAEADLELVEVYVLAGRVEAGADAEQIRSAAALDEVQASTVVDGIVTDLEDLDGMVAAVDLVPGEQLLASRLIDEASYDSGRNRLTSVPEDKHEVTVSLDPERALGGQVQPGDTVSVLLSFDPFDTQLGAIGFDEVNGLPEYPPIEAIQAGGGGVGPTVKTPNTSHMTLHKVQVTRVQLEELPQEGGEIDGEEVSSGELAPTGNLLVTLALDAPEVEQVVFTAEFGFIWLSYEPEDASEDGTKITTRGNVYEDAVPDDAAESDDEPVAADAGTDPAEVGS